MDTRDFLAVRGSGARISALLDWERVNYGYVLYDCLLAYLRLVMMGRNEFWPSFCKGYENEVGEPMVQRRDVEYCLMIRSLTPVARGMVEPKKIIVALIEGRKIPFEERRII